MHFSCDAVRGDDDLAAAIALSMDGGSARGGKRARPCMMELAEPGEELSLYLPPIVVRQVARPELVVRHGSSLQLIAQCTSFLNEEFSDADPSADWDKWQQKGASLYFLSIYDDTSASSGAPAAVLRLVLDGDFGGGAVGDDEPRRRVVIDYLSTSKRAQGRGHASRLLEVAKQMAQDATANCFVLALEESCPYWMNCGFVLEEALAETNRRLNLFPDTHLLKLDTNMREDDDPLGPYVREENKDEEDEEGEGGEHASSESGDSGGGSSSSGSSSGSSRGSSSDGSDDPELQQALLASTGGAGGWAGGSGGGNDDAELQAALLASRGGGGSFGGDGDHEDGDDGGDDGDNGDAEMQAAIAASLA